MDQYQFHMNADRRRAYDSGMPSQRLHERSTGRHCLRYAAAWRERTPARLERCNCICGWLGEVRLRGLRWAAGFMCERSKRCRYGPADGGSEEKPVNDRHRSLHVISLADPDRAFCEGRHPVVDDQLAAGQSVLDCPVAHLVQRDQRDRNLQAVGQRIQVQVAGLLFRWPHGELRPPHSPDGGWVGTDDSVECDRQHRPGIYRDIIGATERLFAVEERDLEVRTHVGHLLAKLNLRRRGQAIVFAYEQGLVGTDSL